MLFVCHGYIGGPVPLRAGAEMAAHGLLSHLAARGHTVHVVCTPGPHEPATGYEVGGVFVLPGRETSSAMWGGSYDIMITHLNATPTALHAADRAVGGMPTVVLLHNDHDPTMQLLGNYLSFGWERLAVANSNWLARKTRNFVSGHLLSHKVGVLTAHPMVRVNDYRAPKDGRGRIVTLVNTAEKKGGALLAQLAERMPDVRFLAVTGAYGRQETYRYDGLANVVVLPNTRDMRSVYAETDVLMMGGTYESWGRVGVEAASSGIPTVSTPMPGPLEALGDAAIFVDQADLDGWERAIRSLLDDPFEYDRRSALCVDRAVWLESQACAQRDMFADVVEEMVTDSRG